MRNFMKATREHLTHGRFNLNDKTSQLYHVGATYIQIHAGNCDVEIVKVLFRTFFKLTTNVKKQLNILRDAMSPNGPSLKS